MWEYSYYRHNLIKTDLVFLLLPKRCNISNKFLWLKYAYVHTFMYTGPGEPIIENLYFDKNEFLIARLQGKL